MIVANNQGTTEGFPVKKSYSTEDNLCWTDMIENTYPSQRRSLVEENKQKWLKDAPEDLSRNDGLMTMKSTLSSSLTTGNSGFETGISEEPEQSRKPKAHANVKTKVEEKEQEEATLIISLKNNMMALTSILKTIDEGKGVVIHMESRPSRDEECQFDVLVKLQIKWSDLAELLKTLRHNPAIHVVNVMSTHSTVVKEQWYPRHISDLDLCNHLMTKFEPDLDMNHPGFSDKSYRARRKMIADIAFDFKFGDPIPRVEYLETEITTWRHVFNKVVSLLSSHACKQYADAFRLLQREVGYRPDNIPQLDDVSNFLKRRTGFTLRPAAGLLSARDFLASLAFRVFQCTQYVRHASSPDHSPEPDCIHELLGHVPMLADPTFAQFSQELGLASLGATDEEIEQFSTVYWFTVEFGLCKENGITKAYGAGLMSSFGELEHALSDKPEHRNFDPKVTAVQPYQDQDYQDVYFVAESFTDAKEKFRRWVAEFMSRPYEVRYDPFTQNIEILDSADKLDKAVMQLQLEVNYLSNAVSHMKLR
ncbi:unnamed protein product [Orchesella dallaii]|uniref:Tyrosine 3-monooxygenase n=1 Tax=Orchesella dallaii TaxID=48710 RepID=A0ABP1PVJ3_9HEXA